MSGFEKKKISNLKGCIYPGLFAISLIAMAGTKSPKMKLTTMLSEPILFSLNGESELQVRGFAPIWMIGVGTQVTKNI